MDTIETPIAIRAYSERPGREPLRAKPPSAGFEASPWTLVFDCETTIDATQRLRFGFYQVRDAEELHEEGLFYDASAITRAEQALVRTYAESRNLRLLTVEAFRSDVFLRYGYSLGGTIIGFNLPFDISRIATGHGSSRFHMRGGFSFVLTRDREDPRDRVKHLNGHAALIDFSKPGEEETPRGMRKRRLKSVTNRGHFVDLKTLARALFSRPFSLASLASHLGTPTQKLATDEHGKITKTPEWSYEHEWRMLVPLSDAEQVISVPDDTVYLFTLPLSAITAVVLGARSSVELRNRVAATVSAPEAQHIAVKVASLDPDSELVRVHGS